MSWASKQAGSVFANNLIWCDNDATNFVGVETDGGFLGESRNNLVWDHVVGSATDPKLAGGAFPGHFALTALSATAIDQGYALPASYTRDGIAVPVFDRDGGAADIGALRQGQAVWAAGTTLPAAPTALRVDATTSSTIVCAWTDGSADESGFALEWSTDGLTWRRMTTAADATGATITGLAASTTYRLRVRAFGADGDSLPSDEIRASTGASTGAPEIAVSRGADAIADGAVDDLGSAALGARAVTYTIANVGSATLTLGSVGASSLVNCSAALTQPGGNVAAGASTTCSVTVTPAAAGDWSCRLAVVTNDSDENPSDWTLSGSASAGGSGSSGGGGGGSGGGGCGLGGAIAMAMATGLLLDLRRCASSRSRG